MRRALVILVGLVLLLGSSCGSDGDAAASDATTVDDASAEEPTTTAVAPEPTAEVATPEPTAAPTEEPTAEPTPEPTALPEPEPIDASNLQERLLDAQPGDVIEIPAGTFYFDRGLSLDVDGVTIRGAGIDDTILSFADQVAGAEGLLVTASDFTIEDLAIEDTIGDALKINEGQNVIIRRVRTEWTNGYATDNGAYGIYPVQITNVLIEDSVAIGASDAGIYVGQSKNIIVRWNRAEFNVAGIEIENSINADVYGNTATNNTGGILVFNLPNLAQEGFYTRVYDNDIFDNNIENFAHAGTIVADVPSGSGILVMANDQVEIFDNRIYDNNSANIIITSTFTVGAGGEDDPNFDGYPEGVYIHDNELSGSGSAPDGILAALSALAFADGSPLPDIVWDGALDEAKLVDGAPLPEDRICVQQPGSDVLNADGVNGFAAPIVDTAAFDCVLDALEPVVLSGIS